MYRLCGEENEKKIEKYRNIRITLHNNKLYLLSQRRDDEMSYDQLSACSETAKANSQN